ncbi:MAG: T9SS type A sorting domain-containing protein [Candidatus Marinimicrobia bacterium]|nr:T9SS type A sorting domain-containing protein [Candidatus Neomarinimicrobiota bacterium]
MKQKLIILINFLLFFNTGITQITWNTSVIDSVPFHKWGYWKGYSYIDLISEGDYLQFSAKILKDSLDQSNNIVEYGIICYGKYLDGRWQINRITQTKNGWHARPTSLCIGNNGNPSIFYIDHPWNYDAFDIKNAKYDENLWILSDIAERNMSDFSPISAFSDQNGIGCAYRDVITNAGPNYEQYFIIRSNGDESWHKNKIIDYNSDRENFWPNTGPNLLTTADKTYLVHGMIKEDTAAVKVFGNEDTNWETIYEYTNTEFSSIKPVVGYNNFNNTLHIYGSTGLSSSQHIYLIKIDNEWNFSIIDKKIKGVPADDEFYFSQNGTSFWLQSNINLDQLWLYWRTNEGQIGHTEIPRPDGLGTKTDTHVNYADFAITEQDSIFVLYHYNCPDKDNTVGLALSKTSVDELLTGVKDQDNYLENKSFNLIQNYPNPFNSTTIIKYNIPRKSKVVLKIYDIAGNLIYTPCNEYKNAGTHKITWTATNIPTGIYFYKFKAGNFTDVKKCILMK